MTLNLRSRGPCTESEISQTESMFWNLKIIVFGNIFGACSVKSFPCWALLAAMVLRASRFRTSARGTQLTDAEKKTWRSKVGAFLHKRKSQGDPAAEGDPMPHGRFLEFSWE